jgi:osmotically-inducible protein OsmY
MESDILIRDRVIAELDFEPIIDTASIGVSAKSGAVTLTGHVPSYLQKLAAERAARRVKGVRAVAIDLEVRLPSEAIHDDEEIARRAANMISWNLAKAANVKATVDNGWVTLTGQAQWNYQKQHAERLVRALEGVTGVSNKIAVQSPVQPTDIKTRISNALKRNAEVEGDAIKVEVSGSTVTLSGNVKAWYERQVVENAAWATPGVTQVRDNIAVQ